MVAFVFYGPVDLNHLSIFGKFDALVFILSLRVILAPRRLATRPPPSWWTCSFIHLKSAIGRIYASALLSWILKSGGFGKTKHRGDCEVGPRPTRQTGSGSHGHQRPVLTFCMMKYQNRSQFVMRPHAMCARVLPWSSDKHQAPHSVRIDDICDHLPRDLPHAIV